MQIFRNVIQAGSAWILQQEVCTFFMKSL